MSETLRPGDRVRGRVGIRGWQHGLVEQVADDGASCLVAWMTHRGGWLRSRETCADLERARREGGEQ